MSKKFEKKKVIWDVHVSGKIIFCNPHPFSQFCIKRLTRLVIKFPNFITQKRLIGNAQFFTDLSLIMIFIKFIAIFHF